MKTKDDAVRGWVRKAQSDLTAMRSCRDGGALDAACFHAQQAAEKILKAYLTACDIRFPFVHNLEQLADLCGSRDPQFSEIRDPAQRLTPYAVQLRYDDDFWPTEDIVERAMRNAETIIDFVTVRLPETCRVSRPDSRRADD
jgi:HEPN domain-containing protein